MTIEPTDYDANVQRNIWQDKDHGGWIVQYRRMDDGEILVRQTFGTREAAINWSLGRKQLTD
jgi:hypothetical protein